MVESLQKLVSELPEDVNVTVTRYQCVSKQEAEDFVKSITGTEPVHDCLYGTAWCVTTLNNIEVIAYYDSEEEAKDARESL